MGGLAFSEEKEERIGGWRDGREKEIVRTAGKEGELFCWGKLIDYFTKKLKNKQIQKGK